MAMDRPNLLWARPLSCLGWRLGALLFALLLPLFAGCEFVAPSGVFKCSGAGEGECPHDYACVSGLCVDTSAPPVGVDGGVPCAPLEAPEFGTVDRAGYAQPGESATFACDESFGYALSGEATLVCGEDGEWSGPAPRCEIQSCGPGQQPESHESTVCVHCPEGRFSADHDRAPCAVWSLCEEYALEAERPSATKDRVCYPRWVTQFGVGNGTDGNAIALGPSGDLFIAGDMGEDAFERGYLARYTPSGERVWLSEMETGTTYVHALAIGADGAIYVAGRIGGAFPGETSNGQSDAFVRRYDAEGELVWTKQFGTSAGDEVDAIAVATDGSIYVAGSTQGAFQDQTHAGSEDAYFGKLSSEGELLWVQQFGSSGSDLATSIAVDEEGSIYVAGESNANLPGHGHRGGDDIFLRKYDAEGEIVWYGGAATLEDDSGASIRLGPDGSVLLFGTTKGNMLHGYAPDTRQAFIRKFHGVNGLSPWTKQFANEGTSHAGGLHVTPDGEIYLFGATRGDAESSEESAFIRKLELGGGQERWTHRFGASGFVAADAGVVAEDGSIFVTGYISDGAFDGYSLVGSHGDAFIAGFIAPEAP